MGMRVAFDLLDEEDHYHGDGRQDIWLYPNGTVHCTFTMQIVDRAGHGPIQDAYVECVDDGRYEKLHVGPETLSGYGATDRPLGTHLAERAVLLENDSEAAALFGSAMRGMFGTSGSDHGVLPPSTPHAGQRACSSGLVEVWAGPVGACTPGSRHHSGKRAQPCACAGCATPA